MRQLHPEAIAAIQSKALFSKAEEQLLSKVGSVRSRADKIEGTGQSERWTTWKTAVGSPHHLKTCLCRYIHICRGPCDRVLRKGQAWLPGKS